MKKIYIIIYFLSFSVNAESNVCDTYYDNVNKYLEIMSSYNNEKQQIAILKDNYKLSREAVDSVKNKEKYEMCEKLNVSVIELINKYKR